MKKICVVTATRAEYGLLRRTIQEIENDTELDSSWFVNKKLCGITAGASTPDWIIQQVVGKIESFN